MKFALEFIWRLKTDFDASRLVGLQEDVFQPSKEGDNPTAGIEPIGLWDPRKRITVGCKSLKGDVECVGCVSDVPHNGLQPPVLVRRNAQAALQSVNTGILLLVHQEVERPCFNILVKARNGRENEAWTGFSERSTVFDRWDVDPEVDIGLRAGRQSGEGLVSVHVRHVPPPRPIRIGVEAEHDIIGEGGVVADVDRHGRSHQLVDRERCIVIDAEIEI